MSHHKHLELARWLATLMDAQFRLPILGKRFGWDAILGLVPGLGDLLGWMIALYIVYLAKASGVSRRVLFKMLINIAIDALAGTIPLIGDWIDASFKANLRNVRLMEQHVLSQGGSHPSEQTIDIAAAPRQTDKS